MTDLRTIDVVAYCANWVDRFRHEETRLQGVFGQDLCDIYHVGSTSVPGLAAKPTIDILVEVRSGTDIPIFDTRMETLGYICRGECLDAIVPGTPGRYYYVLKSGSTHLVHVHVCASDHFEIRQMLNFRDYLRQHPADAAHYGEHKIEIARRFRHDNVGYMRAKDATVRGIIKKAEQWAGKRNQQHEALS